MCEQKEEGGKLDGFVIDPSIIDDGTSDEVNELDSNAGHILEEIRGKRIHRERLANTIGRYTACVAHFLPDGGSILLTALSAAATNTQPSLTEHIKVLKKALKTYQDTI